VQHELHLFAGILPREAVKPFAFFKGACTRGIYDNMKTAVEAVFIGKDRQFNRRFGDGAPLRIEIRGRR
jgi:hypothetical protein